MESTPFPPTAVHAVERRAAARRRLPQGPLLCFLVKGSAHHRIATLRDVSVQGAGLFVSSPLEPGTVLFLQVPGRDRESTRALTARVVDALLQAEGSWLVGCEFDRMLSRDELAEAFPDGPPPA